MAGERTALLPIVDASLRLLRLRSPLLSAWKSRALLAPGSTAVRLLAARSDYPNVSWQLKVPQQLIDVGTVLNRPPEKPPVLLQTAVAGFQDHAGNVLAGVDLLPCCPASP